MCVWMKLKHFRGVLFCWCATLRIAEANSLKTSWWARFYPVGSWFPSFFSAELCIPKQQCDTHLIDLHSMKTPNSPAQLTQNQLFELEMTHIADFITHHYSGESCFSWVTLLDAMLGRMHHRADIDIKWLSGSALERNREIERERERKKTKKKKKNIYIYTAIYIYIERWREIETWIERAREREREREKREREREREKERKRERERERARAAIHI